MLSRLWTFAGCALTAIVTFSLPVGASPIVVGPTQDFKMSLMGVAGLPLTIPTTTTVHVQQLDSNGRCLICTTVSYPDTAIVSVRAAVPVLGVTYIESQAGDFNDNLVLTSIYGIDLNPAGSALRLTGVGAVPEFSFLSGETIIGNSGARYTSSFNSVTNIGNLALLLGQGFDLSPFAAGDPTSNVYVFQTFVPATDITSPVPEPKAWVLCGSGLLFLGLSASRRGSYHA